MPYLLVPCVSIQRAHSTRIARGLINPALRSICSIVRTMRSTCSNNPFVLITLSDSVVILGKWINYDMMSAGVINSEYRNIHLRTSNVSFSNSSIDQWFMFCLAVEEPIPNNAYELLSCNIRNTFADWNLAFFLLVLFSRKHFSKSYLLRYGVNDLLS